MATQDGPRYVVCLQKLDDLCCSTFEYETEKLPEAKAEADRLFQKHDRKRMVHVMDREWAFNDPYRLKPVDDDTIEEEEPAPKKTTRKKEATKTTTKKKATETTEAEPKRVRRKRGGPKV